MIDPKHAVWLTLHGEPVYVLGRIRNERGELLLVIEPVEGLCRAVHPSHINGYLKLCCKCDAFHHVFFYGPCTDVDSTWGGPNDD